MYNEMEIHEAKSGPPIQVFFFGADIRPQLLVDGSREWERRGLKGASSWKFEARIRFEHFTDKAGELRPGLRDTSMLEFLVRHMRQSNRLTHQLKPMYSSCPVGA